MIDRFATEVPIVGYGFLSMCLCARLVLLGMDDDGLARQDRGLIRTLLLNIVIKSCFAHHHGARLNFGSVNPSIAVPHIKELNAILCADRGGRRRDSF
jgi:hypothetical protein